MSSYRKHQCIYIATDLVSSLLIWLAFLLFRWLVYEDKIFGIDTVLIPAFSFWLPLVLFPLGCLIVYYLSGYYLRPYHKSLGTELSTTFISSAIISLGAFFIIIIDDHVSEYKLYLWSLFVLFILHFTLCYLPRLCITLHHRRHNTEEPVVVIEQTAQMSEEDLYHEIAKAFPQGKTIYIVPRMYDILTGAAQIHNLNDSPYVCITKQHLSDSGICIKRACDVTLSTFLLLVLTPLLCCIAIGIRCTSTGPVFYRQERIGLYGRPFTILKFRTMRDHAEPEEPMLTQENDERITSIGHWLRKYRLDELPQLINIIKGDMAIVGPRPERQYFINQIIEQAPYYCLLYKIRPGLTSWGPIKVGYTDSLEKMIERLRYDIAYMENMSIRLDVKILFYTINVILSGKGQ